MSMLVERSINLAPAGAVTQFSATDLKVLAFTVQASNGNGAGVNSFVKWAIAAPADITAATANYDLAPGQSRAHFGTTNHQDRGEPFNLKNWWVKAASGNVNISYLIEENDNIAA